MKLSQISISILLVALTAGGLAAGPQIAKPDEVKPSGETPAPLPPAKLPEGIGQPVDPNKYVLGPEDIIYIKTWREVDFTQICAIRPDGKITIPLVGDVQAAGLTPLALTADLKEKIGKYVNTPDTTVSVQDVRSKKYYIDGEVGRPGAYPLVTPIRVLEALSMAGGFKEFADQKHILILRGTQTFKFNYREVIKGKKTDQDIYLQNGDHIIIR